jgi:hypothetical protein
MQVCKHCAFRCHAELATAIYLSNNITTTAADAQQQHIKCSRTIIHIIFTIMPIISPG